MGNSLLCAAMLEEARLLPRGDLVPVPEAANKQTCVFEAAQGQSDKPKEQQQGRFPGMDSLRCRASAALRADGAAAPRLAPALGWGRGERLQPWVCWWDQDPGWSRTWGAQLCPAGVGG